MVLPQVLAGAVAGAGLKTALDKTIVAGAKKKKRDGDGEKRVCRQRARAIEVGSLFGTHFQSKKHPPRVARFCRTSVIFVAPSTSHASNAALSVTLYTSCPELGLNSNVIFFVATFSQLPETVTAFSVVTFPQGITPFFLPPAAAEGVEDKRRRNHATETKSRDRFETTTPSDKTRIEKRRPRITIYSKGERNCVCRSSRVWRIK